MSFQARTKPFASWSFGPLRILRIGDRPRFAFDARARRSPVEVTIFTTLLDLVFVELRMRRHSPGG